MQQLQYGVFRVLPVAALCYSADRLIKLTALCEISIKRAVAVTALAVHNYIYVYIIDVWARGAGRWISMQVWLAMALVVLPGPTAKHPGAIKRLRLRG